MFPLRDLLWAMATIALIAAWAVTSREHASRVGELNEQLAAAERTIGLGELKAAETKAIQKEQAHEIMGLRQLLKQSLGDRRRWFELQVEGNRIIAIGPATSESVEVTPRVVDIAEKQTGLDGQRLRHFSTPIEQLKVRR